jgi:hypothetical protein
MQKEGADGTWRRSGGIRRALTLELESQASQGRVERAQPGSCEKVGTRKGAAVGKAEVGEEAVKDDKIENSPDRLEAEKYRGSRSIK